MNDYPTDPCPLDSATCPHGVLLGYMCAACVQVIGEPLYAPLTAAQLCMWLDAIIRQYGEDIPLYVEVGGMPLQIGDAKLKTNGRDTHVVVFLPVQEDV